MTPVYVVSKGRPLGSTMRLLEECPALPWVVVVEPQDNDRYAARWGVTRVLVLPDNDQGLAYARNWILEHHIKPSGTWAWMLDDDVTSWNEVVDGRLRKISAEQALRRAEEVFTQPEFHAAQAALEYGQFAWAARRAYVLNGYCDVAVCIHGGRAGMAQYFPELVPKEDRDFTLQLLANGWQTVRVTVVAFTAPKNGSNAGGLSPVYQQDGREAEASQLMSRKWPGVCTPHTKPDGRPDVKINWKAFKPTEA